MKSMSVVPLTYVSDILRNFAFQNSIVFQLYDYNITAKLLILGMQSCQDTIQTCE